MKLVNADSEDKRLQRETEQMSVDKEGFDASLINTSIIDEISIRLEELESNLPLTHGDGQLASLLQGVKDELSRSTSVEETSNTLYNIVNDLRAINSKYAPKVRQNLLKLLSFLAYRYNQESKIGKMNNKIQISNAIREVFSQANDPRREDNTYQSTPIGAQPSSEGDYVKLNHDENRLMGTEEPPKVEPAPTSMNPLVDINTHVHELDDLINRALEKAVSLQHKAVDFNGGNTQSKVELVNTITTLLRRLQVVQNLSSMVSYTVNKKLKTKID